MIQWQPTRRTAYQLLALVAVITTVGIMATLATPGAAAEADMTMDGLDIANTNKTVSGNVTDATLKTTLNYQHEVPDATRRIIKLKVGPSTDNMELVDYQQTREPAGTASGTATLSGSILSHPSWTADTLDPSLADQQSTEIVVQAVIEVQRAGGDAVTHTVTDTATITLTDDSQLTATLGGDGSITVETTG